MNDFIEKVGFRRYLELNVEAINIGEPRAWTPTRCAIHLCLGDYEGPHHLDMPLSEIIDIVLSRARPTGVGFESAKPATSTSGRSSATWRCRGQGARARRHRHHHQLRRAPPLVAQRIERFAGLVGKERVVAYRLAGFGTFAGVGSVSPTSPG